MDKFSVDEIVAFAACAFGATLVIAIVGVLAYEFFPYSIVFLAAFAAVFAIAFRLIVKAVIKADELDRERLGS